LRSHAFWDRVVDVSQLGVAVSVLTVFVPLAVSFVFKMATLLGLESLVHLSKLNLSLVLRHLLLHHLLGLAHLLLHILLRLLVIHLVLSVHSNVLLGSASHYVHLAWLHLRLRRVELVWCGQSLGLGLSTSRRGLRLLVLLQILLRLLLLVLSFVHDRMFTGCLL